MNTFWKVEQMGNDISKYRQIVQKRLGQGESTLRAESFARKKNREMFDINFRDFSIYLQFRDKNFRDFEIELKFRGKNFREVEK